MKSLSDSSGATKPAKFFYGWSIVIVGFFAHIASAFSISSTLSVFLKPLAADLGVSRGVFSLIRSGEVLVGAITAPLIGSLLDRYGSRWLMTAGSVVLGVGLMLLGQARDFWQFLIIRWLLVSPGDVLMGNMVVNVTISRWFVRMRGRALALAGMGHGFAKVCMPLFAASLIAYAGWRGTWVVFGVLTLLMVVGPAYLFMRRRPEDMGLMPDGGAAVGSEAKTDKQAAHGKRAQRAPADDVAWTRREALRTPAFWLIVVTFGVAHIGVSGLNLHVFSFVSDQGYPLTVAALVMSTIALMQFSTPLVWGLGAERMNIPRLMMMKFLFQAAGISLALLGPGLASLYCGFFLYGIGMGGTQVLAEVIWANYFGRVSLGTIRGLGSLLTYIFSACGPPFFGFLFDATKSYRLSFTIFIGLLVFSSVLSLFLRPPAKK